jgi:hypothetical protein
MTDDWVEQFQDVGRTNLASFVAPLGSDARPLYGFVETETTGGVLPTIALSPPADPAAPRDRVQFLKEEMGLTWDQMGKLFGVSRRAVHLWTTGGRMNGSNIERLGYLETNLLGIAGDSDARRSMLFDGANGPSLYDALRADLGSRGNVVSGDVPEEI